MDEVTTIIATLNEEIHIDRCVRSVDDLGPVFVVDAGSRDGTAQIARSAGATVIEHEWQGYSEQKNWALGNLPIATEWVLFLDADEYLTPELIGEIRTRIAGADYDAYYVPRMNIFMGTVLKHAWWYPDHQLRLFRVGHGRFETRAVHESVLVDGEAGFLESTLYHENLKGIDAFVARHLKYAGLEAQEMLRVRQGRLAGQRTGRLFGTWPERRRFLKLNVWYRMPGRPLVRFVWLYFVRRGFLDGRAGRVYCSLLASYEALIDAKLAELEAEGAHPPGDVSGEPRRVG